MTYLRSFWSWAFALVCSVIINISLFGLMPGLIQQVPDMPGVLEEVRQVSVVRIKKALTPPQKKEQEKPKKSEPAKTIAHTKTFKQRPVEVKPILKQQLAFQLNPKLPPATMDLVMPGLEDFSMDAPMKSHYTMGELDSPLIALVKIPPIYPILATRRGIEGYVTVEFLVTKKGVVEQIRIIDSTPKHIFGKSVTTCVSQWKFTPGTMEGIPVASMAQTTIRFRLEK